MKPPFDLIPIDGLITVTAGYTPTANIHEPDSTYAQLSGREGVSHEGE